MFNITINGEVFSLSKKTRILDLLPKEQKRFIACMVNNRLRELTYEIEKEADIRLIDLSNFDGTRIYEASMRYVFCMALRNLKPNATVQFNQFISRTVSCSIENLDCLVNQEFLELLNLEMQRIINNDYPIERKVISKSEAVNMYKKFNYQDKIELLKYRPDEVVHFYECNGYINYLYNYMVPSTGYLKNYQLILYYPLILMQYPRYDYFGKMPEFLDSPKFCKTLLKSDRWATKCQAANIAEINKHVLNGSMSDLINMCETRHNNMLAELGNNILAQKEFIKIVAIAGPSSSGKTTFCNRLRIELLNKGFSPVMISIDDFYLPRELAPRDAEGKFDFEHINALDITLFNKTMLALISGEEVTLPHFNFKKNLREVGRKIKMDKDSIIMIEGLHALNSKLTPLIPRYQKYNIYISPSTQVNIDSHSPISLTDVRLVRRMVRDYYYRNTAPEETFGMWRSVRNGEFNWIYPFQEESDFIFDSELTYEFCIMKKYAVPLLQKIPSEHKYFVIANRLIKFLKYFEEIDEKLIPCNSILREFIGGSCF